PQPAVLRLQVFLPDVPRLHHVGVAVKDRKALLYCHGPSSPRVCAPLVILPSAMGPAHADGPMTRVPWARGLPAGDGGLRLEGRLVLLFRWTPSWPGGFPVRLPGDLGGGRGVGM